MGMDMTDYKMIYKDQVFNVIAVSIECGPSQQYEKENTKIEFIEAVYIDENGELKVVKDEALMFKFVRR